MTDEDNISTRKLSHLKLVWGSLGVLIPIISAVFFIDERYAHAVDVESYNTSTQRALKTQELNLNSNILRLHKQLIDQQVYEAELKIEMSSRPSATDKARLNLLRQQSEDLNQQIISNSRSQGQLR